MAISDELEPEPIAVFVLPTIPVYNPACQWASPMAKRRIRSVRARLRSTANPGPGRPPVHTETWSKVSVVLFDRQVHHLDRLSSEVRAKRGKVLNRAEIIRALIDGLLDS